MKIELLQWIYVAIVAPVLGGLGGWISSVLKDRRRKKALVDYLAGLPSEAKATLVELITAEKHTMRGDPMDPPMRLLIQHGVLVKGPGGGTYDAVDSYISMKANFWHVRHLWLVSDPEAMQIHLEFLQDNQRADTRT